MRNLKPCLDQKLNREDRHQQEVQEVTQEEDLLQEEIEAHQQVRQEVLQDKVEVDHLQAIEVLHQAIHNTEAHLQDIHNIEVHHQELQEAHQQGQETHFKSDNINCRININNIFH